MTHSDFAPIEFSAEDAAVIFDLVRSMHGVGNPEAVMLDLRRARYLLPKVERAFEASGWGQLRMVEEEVDIEIVRPEIPLLVPGSRH